METRIDLCYNNSAEKQVETTKENNKIVYTYFLQIVVIYVYQFSVFRRRPLVSTFWSFFISLLTLI